MYLFSLLNDKHVLGACFELYAPGANWGWDAVEEKEEQKCVGRWRDAAKERDEGWTTTLVIERVAG